MRAILTYSDRIELDPCMLCDSVLNITAQSTAYKLQFEIKGVLENLPSIHSFHGFEISKSSDAEHSVYRMNAYVEASEPQEAYLTGHVLAQQALQSKEMKFIEQDQRFVCFMPVQISNETQNLWLIECDKGNHAEPYIADVYLMRSVYQNCVSHIDLQNTDPLTGLENRQALSERLSRMLKGMRRDEDSKDKVLPSICMLDIDFFKRVNDDYGHLYGDEVLLLFSGLMKKTFREIDFLYRYGGEEFVVLLATSTLEESLIALERFRSVVEAYDFPQVGNITISIGFVQMRLGELPSLAMDKADKALYYAKENGRNNVSCYDSLIRDNLIEAKKLKIDSELF